MGLACGYCGQMATNRIWNEAELTGLDGFGTLVCDSCADSVIQRSAIRMAGRARCLGIRCEFCGHYAERRGGLPRRCFLRGGYWKTTDSCSGWTPRERVEGE